MIPLLLASLLATGASTDGEAQVRAALEDAVRERLALGSDATVTVTELRPSEPALLRRYHALSGLELPPGERGLGRVTARVEVVPRRGAPPRDTWVVARVSVEVPTVVTTRRISRGEPLTPRDVAVVPRPLDEAGLPDPGLVVGRVARHTLAEGEVLRAERLELPTIVRRGDRVDALVTGRAFRLKTAAEALGRGGLGAEIPVRVLMTGKVVTAAITGPGRVEVLR